MLSRLLHLTRGSEKVEGDLLGLDMPLDSGESFSSVSAVVVAACFPFEVSGKMADDFFISFKKGSLGWWAIKSLKSS